MPSYQTAPSTSPAPDLEQSRNCAVYVDPAAQRAALLGNAATQDALSPAVDAGASGGRWSADLALRPLTEMLNDPEASMADRAAAMLTYRNQMLASSDWATLYAMKGNDPTMPLYSEGEKAGSQFPLFERLGQDPVLQAMVAELAQRAMAMPPDQVDIQALWAGTQESAAEMAGLGGASSEENSVRALQAMATFMNVQKFDKQSIPVDPSTGLPTIMPEGVSPELWAILRESSRDVRNSPSTQAAVMSHGAPAKANSPELPATADNNYHFWTHAWLSADLQANHGLTPEEAQSLSGFAGAQYELRPGSLREEQGNAGVKDILMNAEGAAFGTELL